MHEDAVFKWWLFACNLGPHTGHVIGSGIVSVKLERKTSGYVELLFTQVDGLETRLRILEYADRADYETRVI